MRSETVRSKLAFWNVTVLAVALLILGIGIFYGAQSSLLTSVNKEMKDRAHRQVNRISQFLRELKKHSIRGITVVGVAKGSNPKILIPGEREPIAMFDRGGGEFEAVPSAPTPQGNDPARPQFRSRNLSLDGMTYWHEPPYDMEAFQAGLRGEELFTDHFDQEPFRVFTTPVRVDGKIERVLQYPQPLTSTYNALAGLKWTLATGMPVILLIATLGGYILTARSLKPVREITETAAAISGESLNDRLEVTGRDEFANLAETFNGMLDRLQGAFGALERSVEQQRRFTADASHELRTPLTVIKANTSLALKGSRSPEEYKKTLLAINAAADSMGRLVNDLLLLARSDNGRVGNQMELVCLRAILKDAVASVARPDSAPITLEMEDEGVEVLGDDHSMRRVFVNLLENAVRYTPPEGSISVKQRIVDGSVAVSVTDTGVGISSEHLPHLTDRFYRVDEARGPEEGGNGLGLSICTSIVEAHHGTMSIDSEPGNGTTVTVTFPIATTETEA